MTPAEKLSQSKPRKARKPTNHPKVWTCAVCGAQVDAEFDDEEPDDDDSEVT